MATLNTKLLRELSQRKAQVLTIALVVAAGITAFITMRGAYHSLGLSKRQYYAETNFADLFVMLKRAPEQLTLQLERVEGVSHLSTRLVHDVRLSNADAALPIVGQAVSLQEVDQSGLNQVRVMRGRMPEPDAQDEILLLDQFAEKRDIALGSTLDLILKGREHRVRVVGTATSPEYVFAVPPSGGTGFEEDTFFVVWLNRRALAAATNMEGAFNSLALRLGRGGDEQQVISRVDDILRDYGGLGVITRDKQPSNYFVSSELEQLSTSASTIPIIFLCVAAFVLNVVLGRWVELQRSNIAALKAVGYADRRIATHYAEYALVIVLIGALLGLTLGIVLGKDLTIFYGRYFHFPNLHFSLPLGSVLVAILGSLFAGLLGAALSYRRIARMPAAEAMRPAAPGIYRKSWLETGLSKLLSQSGVMVLREITRRPLRAAVSALSIAAATGILVMGRASVDMVDYMLEMQFGRAWREDLSVAFVDYQPRRSAHALTQIEGVAHAEGFRTLGATLRVGHRSRDIPIFGYPENLQLRQLIDSLGNPHQLPESGLVLTSKLGEILGVGLGDSVELLPREGKREAKVVRITGLVDEMMGLQGYMDLQALSELLQQQPVVTGALLEIDPLQRAAVEQRLDEMPQILGIVDNQAVARKARKQFEDSLLYTALILTIFASIIIVGVTYNNARVSLSLRRRELAGLRVLGMTRAEVTRILLGELTLHVLIAIPIGLWFGESMIQAMYDNVDPERYRFHVDLSLQTFAVAATVTVVSAAISAWWVSRRLRDFDVTAVLKEAG